jgi:putative transposase
LAVAVEQAIEEFIDYYNNQRYHKALNNVTPADVFSSQDKAILDQREHIKQATLIQQRTQNLLAYLST